MSKDPYETIPYKSNYLIKIYRDDDAENPREAWDNVGQMICWHRRYNLGDKHQFSDPEAFYRELYGQDEWEILEEKYKALFDEAKEDDARKELRSKFWQTVWDKIGAENIILKLYLYDHSGISMSCSSFIGRAQHAEWDSGPVGYIYCTDAKAREEWLQSYGEDGYRAQAEKYLTLEVKTYNQYLTGEVFGYQCVWVQHDEDGEISEEEDLDSCWGFYGDQWEKEGGSWEYMLEEAKSSCDYDEKKRFPLLVPIISTENENAKIAKSTDGNS